MNSSTHPQVQRSLAAIVITDAVGFSKWMSRDEDTALKIINRDLQVIQELCVSFEGKILKTTGDGVLMYFISGVQAVSCAVEVQKKFASFAKDTPSDQHFTHRIGIHLGDIFFNQEDIMGTSVNIAARLESEAKPGAICMSQVVYEVVKYRLDLDAVYAGELSLKNIEQTVSAYHVWPPETQHSRTPEQFSESVFALVTPLNSTLKVFASQSQSHRIKKLLYATHRGIWESDPDILKSVSLKLLVESLTSKNETLVDCKDSLGKIIRTLNQPKRYSKIAQIIIDNVQDFYIEENTNPLSRMESFSQNADAVTSLPFQQSHLQKSPNEVFKNLNLIVNNLSSAVPIDPSIPEIISNTLKEFYAERSDGSLITIGHVSQLENLIKNSSPEEASLCREISSRLEILKNKTHVKQLLYYVCCDQWESQVERIQAVPMLSLVQGLYQQIESQEMLRNQLQNVLSKLKRKTAYSSAAGVILRESRSLYAGLSKPSSDIYIRRIKSLV